MLLYRTRFISHFCLWIGLAILFLFSSQAEAVAVGEQAMIKSNAELLSPFDLQKLRGKVVLVFNWSTECPVCLDKMAELRSNVSGWKDKSFVIVAINHDANRQNFTTYVATESTVHVSTTQMIHLYAKDLQIDNLYSVGRLPESFLVAPNGTLHAIYRGRIPANAWDAIADLLP